jgi:hypothetical protein
MPIIKFHNSEEATAFLYSRRCVGEYQGHLVACAHKFMTERYGYDFIPFVNGYLHLTEDQTERVLSFVAVANAMMRRDANNKVMKRWDEVEAVGTPTYAWAKAEGPLQRERKTYYPLEMAYDHPEAVDLLREHVVNHGYIDHDLLNEVMETPMTMARGVL